MNTTDEWPQLAKLLAKLNTQLERIRTPRYIAALVQRDGVMTYLRDVALPDSRRKPVIPLNEPGQVSLTDDWNNAERFHTAADADLALKLYFAMRPSLKCWSGVFDAEDPERGEIDPVEE
jgi:hypothetical protein